MFSTARNICVFAFASLSLVSAVQAAPTHRQHYVSLTPLTAAEVSPSRVGAICDSLSIPCNPASTSLFAADHDAQSIYLIDASYPMLVIWDTSAPDDSPRYRQWNFSNYTHSFPGVDNKRPGPLQIHPALYPVGNNMAVALVSQTQETSSKGDASLNVADFVRLENTTQFDAVYTMVPFSCLKMIKACSSDAEYQSSSHCLEESFGYLAVQPQDSGSWKFIWTETNWPAHSTKQHEKLIEFTLSSNNGKQNSTLSEVSFCGISGFMR